MISFVFLQANAQIDARLFRYPDVSKDRIAFSYGGDIWTVPIDGGVATKLSSPAGPEIAPKFSPDGEMLAFTGNYDGNSDIYTVAVGGGVPKRVTHHGMADRIQDWYPDGMSLLFTSSMESGKQRFNQFYKISREGGLPTKLPIAYGEFGSLSGDGKKIVFTDKSRVFRNWKRYKGGMAAEVFVFDLETYESYNISNSVANDELPMWHSESGKIFFLSDRGAENRYNVWSYNLKDKKLRQVTKFKDFDVHTPSLGPKHMVFEAGGKMYILGLSDLKPREVKIQITSDFASLKPRSVDASKYIDYVGVAPDGKRAIVEARGDLFSLPAEDGVVQNLTRSSGVAERYPAWSPDGRYIAYWSDASGEYELTLKDLKMRKEERKVTTMGAGFRYQIYWSPDSKSIAFVDQTMTILLLDVESGSLTKVDQDRKLFEGGLRGFSVAWSSDSKWIAYDKDLENDNSAVFLYNVNDKKTTQVTSGFYSDHVGAFDVNGEFLFVSSNRNFDPLYSDFDNSFVYSNATALCAIALRQEVQSPLAPKNDTVTIASEKAEVSKESSDSAIGKNGGEEDLVIELEGFERRLIEIPIEAGNIGRIGSVKDKIVYMRYPNTGADGGVGKVMLYDLKEQEEKTLFAGARDFSLASNGKKILVRASGTKAAIVDVAPDQKMEDMLPFDDMEMEVDPRSEWKQIFTDAWRFERDFFYDSEMHGVDWDAMRIQYGDLINYAVNRDDVNFAIGELIAELNASHTYRGGGDSESASRKSVGYLGVNWSLEGGHYRIKEVIKGADWDNEVRSPLDLPGVDVAEGDWILAVNGISLIEYTDPWGAFQGLANKTVELVVNDKPSFEDARSVLVKTIADETRLRNLAWIENNRKKVDEASGGKIGYVYVPSTGVDGQTELVRQFYAQWNKEGLVIDERFNNGGQIPDRFVELLNRKPLAYFSVRDGKDWQWPPIAHFGTMAMLANGWSGSGGDAFPDYFKKSGLGPVIGTRTWGGLIGISGSPALIDGGSVTVPTFRMYNPDGTWFKEGYGVEPDIEVPENPTELAKGVDGQLDAAIKYILSQIEKKGDIHPKRPPREKRS